MSFTLATGGQGTVATAQVIWSFTGQTYTFRSDNNFLSWITTIFEVADAVTGGLALTNPLILPNNSQAYSLNTLDNNATGGYINLSGGDYDGGYIDTSGGGDGAGGSINLTNGGGSIDTTGQGSIGLGNANSDNQTLITGTATENRTATFPDYSGTIALVLQKQFTITFGTVAGHSFVASQSGFADTGSGDPVLVTCTTSRLLSGLSQNIIFDGYISVSGTVVIVAHNPTTLPIVLTALVFNVVVFKL